MKIWQILLSVAAIGYATACFQNGGNPSHAFVNYEFAQDARILDIPVDLSLDFPNDNIGSEVSDSPDGFGPDDKTDLEKITYDVEDFYEFKDITPNESFFDDYDLFDGAESFEVFPEVKELEEAYEEQEVTDINETNDFGFENKYEINDIESEDLIADEASEADYLEYFENKESEEFSELSEEVVLNLYCPDLDKDGFPGEGDCLEAEENPVPGLYKEVDGTTLFDCNDGDKEIYPGASELPNGLDDNCSGFIDDGKLEVLISGAAVYMDYNEISYGQFPNAVEDYGLLCASELDPSHCQNPNNPIIQIPYGPASELCKSIGKRLPTEEEWVAAYNQVGGFNAEDKCTDQGNVGKCSSFYPMASNQDIKKPTNLGGNVSEWVDEWLVKGGNFSDFAGAYDPSWTGTQNPSEGHSNVGFRCVRDVPK